MPSVIVLFLEVDAFAGAIFTFAYIVIDRLVVDLCFGIVIEGVVSTDGGVVYGAILVAVIDVGFLVSDLDIALFTAFGACFLVLYDDGLILFLFFGGSLFFLLLDDLVVSVLTACRSSFYGILVLFTAYYLILAFGVIDHRGFVLDILFGTAFHLGISILVGLGSIGCVGIGFVTVLIIADDRRRDGWIVGRVCRIGGVAWDLDADVGIGGTATVIDGLISTEAGDEESCDNCVFPTLLPLPKFPYNNRKYVLQGQPF